MYAFSHLAVLGLSNPHMSRASVIEAVNLATMYTHHGIATAFPMGSGHGHGPLNHMHPLLPRVLPRLASSLPLSLVRTNRVALLKKLNVTYRQADEERSVPAR